MMRGVGVGVCSPLRRRSVYATLMHHSRSQSDVEPGFNYPKMVESSSITMVGGEGGQVGRGEGEL